MMVLNLLRFGAGSEALDDDQGQIVGQRLAADVRLEGGRLISGFARASGLSPRIFAEAAALDEESSAG